MNPKQAEYFLEVVKSRSITIAAKKLFISQPALSQMMKKLETELEVELFVRGTIPLQLTKAGEKLVSIARDIITFQHNIDVQIQSLKKLPTHSFHLGVLFGYAEEIIVHVLQDYIKTHPRVEVSITEAGTRTIEQMLLDNQLDIGVFSGSPTNSMFTYTALKHDTMGLLAGKDSAFAQTHVSGATINFDEIGDLSFVAKPKGTYSRLLLDTLSHIHGIPLKITYELENLAPIKSSMSSLGCVALMPMSYYHATPELYETMNYYYIDYSEIHYQELLCHHKNLYIYDDLADFILALKKYLGKNKKAVNQ